MKFPIPFSILIAALHAGFVHAQDTQRTLTISGSGTLAPGTPDTSGQVTISSGTLTVTATPVAPAAPVPVAAASSPATGYELRGFFGVGERAEASIRTPGSVESKWYKVGKKSGQVLVEKVDTKAGTAVVLAGGRRLTLKLSGESASATAVVESPKAEEKPELSDADKARKARQERFRQMRENSTAEQQAEFGRVLREKMEAMRKDNPEMMNPDNFNDPEKRKQMGEVFRANMREAAEAAAKLPGKDGKVAPVPEDFNQLMIDEGKDMEARGGRFRGRGRPAGDAAPAADAPAAAQLPAPTPSGK
jgi:hypothetical protein